MSLSALAPLLESTPEYVRLLQTLSSERAGSRAQVLQQGVPFTLSALQAGLGVPILVIAPGPEDARRLYEQLIVWGSVEDSVLHFPETESLPFERLVADTDTMRQRIAVLSDLVRDDGPRPLVIASSAALAQKTLDRDAFISATHTLRKGDRIDLDEALARWQNIGYRFEPAVDQPGAASRRGGIVDIFPLGADQPSRIELWGDEIDSIRRFDQVTQRSIEMVDSVTVLPAQETLPTLAADVADRLIGAIDVSNCSAPIRARISEELDLLASGSDVEEMNFYAGLFNHGTLLDYMPAGSLIVMYRPTDIAQAAWSTDERTHDLRRVKERRGELPFGFPSSYALWSQIEEGVSSFQRRLDVLPWGADEVVDRDINVLPFGLAPSFYGDLDMMAAEIDRLADDGQRVIASTSVPNRLAEILDERGVASGRSESLVEPPGPGSITIVGSTDAGLSEGCSLSVDGHKLVVLSDAELFGVAKRRRSTRKAARRRQTLLSELNPGDYVVHVEHGIARFIGTDRTDPDEGGREYLVLEYAVGDRLFVPMDHLERVTPYIAPLDRAPSLTRLGTQEWKRAKERVQRSTQEMASELLSLYAERELVSGLALGHDTPWQVELEDSFPFEETPDQLTALADVKADMEEPKPMDRLICGDVGYGKTEIAVRAAFKAVSDGKQVAVLVPTTVLAQQHYLTFTQRLSAYPVSIDVLSRFRTDQEQRKIVEGIASGEIDICVGTHRLIQKDIAFKDLGLVVIDEEQRFGVAQKERLKRMRTEVDVLTMTATPIPRTLHLSLAGIRDMSTIETPPEQRLPIKTYVSEFSDELIREAIRRETDRQGQVFFLHNRVYNIDYFAGYIRGLVPEARVGIAHGQMAEEQLERTMSAFAEREIDVLLCTTIIESGLDFPNVNTLIINRADSFGLAQLYQLRGRVGRGTRRAYAYLMVPPHRSLSEAADKRLGTMLAAAELGAGFDIAMKDLEIRGAGNILGGEQSGHIHAVGFDLYTRLLNEAVEELRGRGVTGNGQTDGAAVGVEQAPTEEAKTSVDLSIPASVPEKYIPDLPIRLSIYHKLGSIASEADLGTIEDELVDRFGPIPWQVQSLLYAVRLKLKATHSGIKTIRREGERIALNLHYEVGGARRPLQRLLGRGVEVGHRQIRIDTSKVGGEWEGRLMQVVERLGDFRDKLTSQIQESAVVG